MRGNPAINIPTSQTTTMNRHVLELDRLVLCWFENVTTLLSMVRRHTNIKATSVDKKARKPERDVVLLKFGAVLFISAVW